MTIPTGWQPLVLQTNYQSTYNAGWGVMAITTNTPACQLAMLNPVAPPDPSLYGHPPQPYLAFDGVIVRTKAGPFIAPEPIFTLPPIVMQALETVRPSVPTLPVTPSYPNGPFSPPPLALKLTLSTGVVTTPIVSSFAPIDFRTAYVLLLTNP